MVSGRLSLSRVANTKASAAAVLIDFMQVTDALLCSLPHHVVNSPYLGGGVGVFQFVRRKRGDDPLLRTPSQFGDDAASMFVVRVFVASSIDHVP